ncbi:MAG: LysM peptidoglycan-binding domain-containing protein [Betaproteobacteria bacterium]|nr:LysM peptidoglycan-binding domain-containing protein [Betaproteobacteria bacterium]
MRPIIKTSLIAVAISLLPFGAQAAGLGQYTIRSKLGQPLDVEIQINASQQELQSLTARIAPSDLFMQANIPYASFVPNVRVTVENRGDRSILKLRTDTPVNEAVASLIVQLNWDEGRVARTYNLLLDPPDLAIRPPAPVEPAVVAQPAPPPPPLVVENPPAQPPAQTPPVQAQAPAPVPTPAPVPEPVPEPAAAPAQQLDLGDEPVVINYQPRSEPVPETAPETVAKPPERLPVQAAPLPIPSPTPTYREKETPAGNYTVKSGDTLGTIASRHMPGGDATLDQMMMALYRANQMAFVGNNINRLKSGAILKIPTANEVQGSTQAEAHKEVRIHAREFNEWRTRLAADVAGRPASPAEGSSGGTRNIDAVPPPTEQDRDRLLIASNNTRQGNEARKQRLEEDLARTQSALKEAEGKIKDLEEIQGLRLKRDQEVAKSQTQHKPSATVSAEPPPAPTPAPVAEAVPPPAPVAETPVATPEPTPAEPPVVAGSETAKEPVKEPSAAIPVEYEPSEEYKDPLWEILTNPLVWGAVALFVAVLFVVVGFRSWRNKRSDIGLDTLSQDATSMFPDETTSFFGDNGGQNVDTSASSVIHTDFSQTGLSIDTNEGVDPVAEADVYMAYGRDSQAEEILNDALKVDPKRGAIYVKLLEIYAQRQDLAQFETTASELLARTEGHGRDWEKAAQMGRRLDPNNPLYSASPSKRGGSEASKLPGLEPTLEEPSKLDMGTPSAPVSPGSPALSDLDFGTSPAVKPSAAATSQLKETTVAQGQMSGMMVTTQLAPTDSDEYTQPEPLDEPSAGDGATEVDFQFEPVEIAPKAAGSIDFDLGKAKAVPSETGKQPISVTVSRQPRQSKQSGAPTVTVSRKAGIKAPLSKVTNNDLAGPLDFDVPAQSQGVPDGTTKTVVSPSVRDGDAHDDEVAMDLEKTGFDPKSLDFDLDLDLDLKSSTAAMDSIAPKDRKGKQPSILAGDPDVLNAGEIDTKLELALAYRDMGDNEGALELLREVAAQGNAAQKAEAKALIANLG